MTIDVARLWWEVGQWLYAKQDAWIRREMQRAARNAWFRQMQSWWRVAVLFVMLVQWGGSGPYGMGGSGPNGTGGSWGNRQFYSQGLPNPYPGAVQVPPPAYGIRPMAPMRPLGARSCTQQFVPGVGWQQVCW